MVLPFLTGLAQVLGTAMQVVQAFHKTSSTTIVGTGGGSGFWNYYSHSNIGRINIRVDPIPEYIERLTKRMCTDNPHMSNIFGQIKVDFEDLVLFNSYEADEQNYKMYNVVSYESQHNEVYFYIWLIDPPKKSKYNNDYFNNFANI